MPTIRIVREPISISWPTPRPIVLDTAMSPAGRDAALNHRWHPGPRSGAPNTLTLRDEPRSGIVVLP